LAYGVGNESHTLDHVQMQALAKAMGVNLSVAYLDGRVGHGDAVDFVKFENGGGNDANGIEDVVLLYR
jgi:ubiquitin thioesterase protein OTUB1